MRPPAGPRRVGAIRTLILDNRDSFTFNLFQLVATVNGEEPLVLLHDALDVDALAALDVDNIIVSPGPGRPERPADIGVCHDAIARSPLPLLGVCLGHQSLGHVYGATIHRAPRPMHGRRSAIHHDGSALFTGIPQGFQVVRYHSLVVDPALPACLQPHAWSDDGCLMAMSHRALPRWGVQFHPESICTEFGARLLTNFRDLTHGARRDRPRPPSRTPRPAPPRLPLTVRCRALDVAVDPERLFVGLFRDAPRAFWLDASRTGHDLARFSFLGPGDGPHALYVTADVAVGTVTVASPTGTTTVTASVYDVLARELAQRPCRVEGVPFDFHCGFVGYFGYELKSELGADARHRSAQPDAAFVLADRVIAYDHETRRAWMLCLGPDDDATVCDAWFDDTARRVAALPEVAPPSPTGEPVTLRLARDRHGYLDDIARCHEHLLDGESYELCLTNKLHASPVRDPLGLYLHLRRINPAPYAALLRFDGFTVLSSSPERFLRIDADGHVESKPIKGTRPRGATVAEDRALRRDLRDHEKDRAENLMIVDLLRNDLGRVCEVGTVTVPKLMRVETYASVHQLVSTVRGHLRDDVTAVECMRAAFPGGSMTGAPKLRTMNLLDALETEARGVYSGALGYLSLHGAADLAIVIRTMVSTPDETTLGVGGAIVALSDARDEFDETLLKARALVDALLTHAHGRDDARRDRCLAALRDHGHTSSR